MTERVSPRILAIVALAATAAFTVALVVFLVRNGPYVIMGVAGVALSVAGGWRLASERGSRRTIGVAILLVGLGLLVGALFAAGGDSGWRLVQSVVALLLVVTAIASARAALARELSGLAAQSPGPSTPPSHPVLLCNPWSGGGKVERFGLVELAESLGIETVLLDRGLDLETLARDAIGRGADCLGMAGGDGSQALVASIAAEHGIPFVCVSAGTRNHFALDLGLDREDPRKSIYAFTDAVERRVDYATVNGRLFVNNVSLGVYATIVQQEGYREAKAETSKALLPELLGQTDRPFDLQFTTPDAEAVDGAFLIMVSNNPYVLGPSFDVSQRRRLDTGRLGVFAVTAETGAQAAAVVTLALAQRGSRSGHAYEFTTEEFEVRSRSGRAYAGIDGEALEVDTPLRFDMHPLGLRMFVPKGNFEAARRRMSHDVKLSDLVLIARGRPTRFVL